MYNHAIIADEADISGLRSSASIISAAGLGYRIGSSAHIIDSAEQKRTRTP
jgi:uncharacterized membrane protein YhiD involved in acid resistance